VGKHVVLELEGLLELMWLKSYFSDEECSLEEVACFFLMPKSHGFEEPSCPQNIRLF
jgi:hypothetical protein